MRRILFICWGNCVRSQMAEAMLRYRGAGRFEALSAGVQPAGFVHAMTIQALTEAGIPARGLRSKGVFEMRKEKVDAVVTLCPAARAQLNEDWPEAARPPLWVHWDVADPILAEAPGRIMSPAEYLDLFRAARDEIREFVERLVLAPRAVLDDDARFAALLREIESDMEIVEEER